MATKEYIIQSEHTSGSTAKHYHGESISTLNTWAANNIPDNAKVSNIEVYYSGKLSLGDTKFYVGYTNDSSSEPGEKIISDQLTTSQKTWRQPLHFSARNIISNYSRINVWMSSGIVYKKFTCYSFKIIYTYTIPNYTVTLNAGAGGTVSGGGTYQNLSKVTLTATPNLGYDFVKWSDGDTNSSREITVWTDVTLSAEFAPQSCEVIIDPGEGYSGAKAIVSGGGQYKFGDTVTIKAEAPIYHAFYAWRSYDIPNGTYIWENPFTFTIDESLLYEGELCDIKISCLLEFTGYTVKAIIEPKEAGKIYWGGIIDLGDGEELYWQEGEVTSEGTNILLPYSTSDYSKLFVEAIPNKGYEFVQWADGVTTNPRMVSLSGDATFGAIFKIDKINQVYNGIFQPRAVYIGTDEAKSVYIGITKNYG